MPIPTLSDQKAAKNETKESDDLEITLENIKLDTTDYRTCICSDEAMQLHHNLINE